MTIRVKRTTVDYREACEMFKSAKERGTAYLTYDYPSKEYIIEFVQEARAGSETMRAFLNNIAVFNINNLAKEELDALSYADSAIKTLVDMGVLE